MKHQHFDLVTFYCLDCPLGIFFITYKKNHPFINYYNPLLGCSPVTIQACAVRKRQIVSFTWLPVEFSLPFSGCLQSELLNMFKQPMQSIKKERHLPKCNIFKKKKLVIV